MEELINENLYVNVNSYGDKKIRQDFFVDSYIYFLFFKSSLRNVKCIWNCYFFLNIQGTKYAN